MKFGVIRFPGSNCERDCLEVVTRILGLEALLFDYRETPNLAGFINCLIIPGGFSFGDYLRVGAVAKAAPIMQSIKDFAQTGGLVIGICNGFQILTEAGLLPGTLLTNNNGRFICEHSPMKVENNQTPFTSKYTADQLISMPVAHAGGNYTVSDEQLAELKENKQIVFSYQEDINGSSAQIAGVCNKAGNVLGLMPHPERCCEEILGGIDGLKLFESILESSTNLVS